MTADDEEAARQPVTVGKAETAEPDEEWPVAILWLPDPTERRGWGTWHVERLKPKKNGNAGFRRASKP